MTASVYYLPSSGHCCVCSGACWHTSPASYCFHHSQAWQRPDCMPWPDYLYYPSTGTTTTWNAAPPYVGRHRRGNPEPGA